MRETVSRILPTVMRAALLGRGPRKCGVLRQARAGDGPGAKLLPAAASARVVNTEDGDSKV